MTVGSGLGAAKDCILTHRCNAIHDFVLPLDCGTPEDEIHYGQLDSLGRLLILWNVAQRKKRLAAPRSLENFGLIFNSLNGSGGGI